MQKSINDNNPINLTVLGSRHLSNINVFLRYFSVSQAVRVKTTFQTIRAGEQRGTQ